MKPITVHTSAKAREYLDTARNGMHEALLGSQMQAQRKAMIQANTPPPMSADPVERGLASGIPHDVMAKANPQGMFKMTHGRDPNPQELKDFQNRINPPEPVSGQEVIDQISQLLA